MSEESTKQASGIADEKNAGRMNIENIEKRTAGDLLYLLKRQYPDGVTTFAPCPICGTSSRGGGFCATCIGTELRRRGVDSGRVSGLLLMLEQQRDLNGRIASATEAIFEVCDEKQEF